MIIINTPASRHRKFLDYSGLIWLWICKTSLSAAVIMIYVAICLGPCCWTRSTPNPTSTLSFSLSSWAVWAEVLLELAIYIHTGKASFWVWLVELCVLVADKETNIVRPVAVTTCKTVNLFLHLHLSLSLTLSGKLAFYHLYFPLNVIIDKIPFVLYF